MKVFKFAAGLAVGYVLGSRAGREKYDQIAAAARKAQDHPAVIEAKQKVKNLLSTATGSHVTADPTPATPKPSTAAVTPTARSPRRQPKSTTSQVGTLTEPLP